LRLCCRSLYLDTPESTAPWTPNSTISPNASASL
jgi:hypothetical protein